MTDPRLITSILFAGLIGWGLLRRVRRTFGRQPVHTRRIWFRIVILTIAGGLVIATSAARTPQTLGPLIAGLACGGALAYAGLRHTEFEVTSEGRFYKPHTYIGLAVTTLFVGRLLYRFLYLSDHAHTLVIASPSASTTYQGSPLTLAVFAALIGYYVPYYSGVLIKTHPRARASSSMVKPRKEA